MLKIGVIGLGKMGKLHFMNALHMEDVKVVAAADKSKNGRKVAEGCHIKAYDDYCKLIDSEDLDVVINSLPNFLKRDSIVYAAEKGLDIFVDKPLARNLGEAVDIVQKVKAEGVRLMVGANYRYFDSVQKLKKTLDEGEVGDVVIATSELVTNGPFEHSLIPKPIPEWWFDKEMAGGGAAQDLGYHLLDIFDWMFGDLEVLYSSFGYRFNLPIEDSATIVLKSRENGTTCVINVGWFSKMIFPKFNFRINLHGTVGYASTDRWAPRNLYFHAIKEGATNLCRRIAGRKLHYLSYTYYYVSFFRALSQFLEAVKRDDPLPISLEGQLDVARIIESIYRQNEGFLSG